jgi:SAM-dependent methyltransferase
MAYSDITFKDKNPIKRWLQQQRLVVATRIANGMSHPRCVLDFGAGNGELCKLIALQFPKARIICYEPTPYLMTEAKENLANLAQVCFCSDIAEIAQASVDILFCLEVFEHLPKAETEHTLAQINRLLCYEGSAVIGVPVEIGLPAIYKGIFRMSRRFGKFDASIKNILLAALRFPPKERPMSEIAPGFSFHHTHMGFDYRNLQARLNTWFRIQQVTSSPFSIFGLWLNAEAYFVVQKADLEVNNR